MILAIEGLIACVIFTLIIIPGQYRNPVSHIMSYPPAIRRRVESLPEYADVIQGIERKHIAAKLISVVVFAIALALVAWFSGAKTFDDAFLHVFFLFTFVNLYDVIVLDIGLFCHIQKVRIPGTEDMDKEYRDPWFHVIGGLKGLAIGAVVALLSAVVVYFIL